MDTKLRTNFINSVGKGQKIPCPKCDSLNDVGSDFCMSCGFSFGQMNRKHLISEEEPESVFAKGLPDWDIEPPTTVVRRKRG